MTNRYDPVATDLNAIVLLLFSSFFLWLALDVRGRTQRIYRIFGHPFEMSAIRERLTRRNAWMIVIGTLAAVIWHFAKSAFD